MNMVAIRATPVVVNKIMQDNRLPQFISNVRVTQNAGISIAEKVDWIFKVDEMCVDIIICFYLILLHLPPNTIPFPIEYETNKEAP